MMKNWRLILIAVGFFGFFVNCSGQKSNPVAVLELFTSQGCSSCPPADANVSRVLKERRSQNDQVFVLSFHVDYWDYLGWKDPFSHSAYSNRQRSYAKTFESGRVYTPQLIVNGTEEFVGSNEGKTEFAIERALKKPATTEVEIEKKVLESSVYVSVSLSDEVQGDADVHMALVEDGVTTNIKRGENRGRKIQYDNIVRQFQTFKAEKSLEARMMIPEDMQRSKARIIVYVQHGQNKQVLGASSVSLL